MQAARMLGNYVSHLAKEKNLSIADLSDVLQCSEQQTQSFLKGRVCVSFEQISNLVERLDVTVEALLAGNKDIYEKTVVHSLGGFTNPQNREFILDLIDDYIDVWTAVHRNSPSSAHCP